MAEPQRQRQRLAPEARRQLLLDTAEHAFATTGYAQLGLADVAGAAGVSKTLLYHYFPDGRPELYAAVISRLATEAVDAVRVAADAPLRTERRLGGVIDALLSFFERHPTAYRLIVVEPWGTGEPVIVAAALALRANLAIEVARLVASTLQPLDRTTAGANLAVATILQVCELRTTGEVGGEEARELAGAFVRGGLGALDLL